MTALIETTLPASERRHAESLGHADRGVERPLPLAAVDQALRERISAASEQDPDFWSFSTKAEREDAHGYFQYPAMMVPRVQRELIQMILQLQSGIRSILDPFAGSGTILSESMYAGLDACVQDVNPLAVLLCNTKVGPFQTELLWERAKTVQSAASADSSGTPEADFPGLNKWFRPAATLELSRLRRAIRTVPELWIRRLFWVTLAETIRLTSNSRTSTYKLHVRPESELSALPLPFSTFSRLLERNLQRHASLADNLLQAGHLTSGTYSHLVTCRLGDSRQPIDGTFDLLVTSPPYGDNTTTVPYGQNSYLPLQWIDLQDIDPLATSDSLRSTYEIDSSSLGGKRPRGDIWSLSARLRDLSPSLNRTLGALATQPRDRMLRVFSFVRDLEQCVEPIVSALRNNAYLVWTVGNRRVGGAQVPLDEILVELLAGHDTSLVASIQRRILSKRMASRNAISGTMRSERILLFRKAPAPDVQP